jgi:hypothetical protein
MVMVALPSPLAVEEGVDDGGRVATAVFVAVTSAAVSEAVADAAGDDEDNAIQRPCTYIIHGLSPS